MTAMGPTGIRRLAAGTAAMTLVLILAGGFVTTTRTGNTIPTWPKSWGHFEGGWWVEWTHRAVAGAVALMVTALAVQIQLRERRAWVRVLGWVAFGAVLGQALLGGLRILSSYRVAVAILHACFGQLVFSTMAAMALVLSEAWNRVPADLGSWGARRLGALTTLLAFLQLVAGAVTRHTGSGLALHLIGAALVLAHATVFASRLLITPLRRGAWGLLAILGLQIALGLGTWAITAGGFVRSHESPAFAILTISLHVAVGAALLAMSAGLTLMCQRGAVPRPALERAPRPPFKVAQA